MSKRYPTMMGNGICLENVETNVVDQVKRNRISDILWGAVIGVTISFITLLTVTFIMF